MTTTSLHTHPAARRCISATGVLFLLGAAGCGNLTAGGADAEAVVSVSGDDPAAAAGAPAGARALEAPFATASEGDEPEGEVEVEFRVFLIPDEGGPVEVSDGDIRVRIDLRGRQEAEVARRAVPATHYRRLRLVFSEIEVEVESGLVIDGVPVVGELRVELEGETVTVERALELEVSDGEVVDLVVDLNAATWLRAADPDLRRVAEAVFAAAVDVVVR